MRVGFLEEMTLKQDLRSEKELARQSRGKGNSTCKGPEVGSLEMETNTR